MDTLNKIINSWWVLFSAVIILNGFGFIYIGFKNNNKNWVIEGILYEIPWIFGIVFSDFDALANYYVAICVVLMLVSIVRSIWVAIKLCDVYDNEEKYSFQSTMLNSSNASQDNKKFPTITACLLCLFLIFLAYAILALL